MAQFQHLTIREIGILISFESYKAEHGRYPENGEELSTVTRTELQPHRFKYWSEKFYALQGGKPE